MSNAALIFLHIPKAGGSTLREFLHKQYSESEIYKIGADINGDIERFARLADEGRNQLKLVTGHMSFGLHTYLPASRYITFLRNPVDRVLSEYRFISTNPYHVLYDSVSKMSLLDYLDCGLSSQISNGQTRLISGVSQKGSCGVPSNRLVIESDYNKAVSNLETMFLLAATLDSYDEALLILANRMKWKWPFYLKRNVTPGEHKAPTKQELERITELNLWDLKLYKYVDEHFTAQVKSQGSGFIKKLGVFRKLNWVYAKSLVAKNIIVYQVSK